MIGCRDCGAELKPRKDRSASGYCRVCSPKHKWTPEARAKASAARKARWERELADPEKRAAAVASGRRLKAQSLQVPDLVAAQVEGRRRSHWLPAGYEALNRTLKVKGFRAAERRKLILDEIAAAERARVAALTPLERQFERLAKAGGRLVEVTPLRRSEPSQTLGGVPSSYL